MSANGRAPKHVVSQYTVVKVNPGKKVSFICQSREWESVDTHWYGNHSVKCVGEDICQMCKDGVEHTWKAYLLGHSHTGGPTFIFQITPLAAGYLEAQTETERGLLGAIIVLNRKGKRKNSPLEAQIRGFDPGVHEIDYDTLERVINVLYRQFGKSPACYSQRN